MAQRFLAVPFNRAARRSAAEIADHAPTRARTAVAEPRGVGMAHRDHEAALTQLLAVAERNRGHPTCLADMCDPQYGQVAEVIARNQLGFGPFAFGEAGQADLDAARFADDVVVCEDETLRRDHDAAAE